jgi:hypothetical protein
MAVILRPMLPLQAAGAAADASVATTPMKTIGAM